MRVHVVSDVHGRTDALARAGDGADALVCLGDLILFLDYHDHAVGILADMSGADAVGRLIALRSAGRFEEARAYSRGPMAAARRRSLVVHRAGGAPAVRRDLVITNEPSLRGYGLQPIRVLKHVVLRWLPVRLTTPPADRSRLALATTTGGAGMTVADERTRCVVVVDSTLPVGLVANTSAVLALSLGARLSPIGPDVVDASGRSHAGITTLPIPVLAGSAESIAQLWLRAVECDDVLVVDVTDVAQATHVYDEYAARLAASRSEDLRYLGIALGGPRSTVNRLTGSLPLLR